MTGNKQDYLLYIAYWLRTDDLLIALDAHMFSHNGYRPATQGPGPGGPQLLGPGPSVEGPYLLWNNICASRAINMQPIGKI